MTNPGYRGLPSAGGDERQVAEVVNRSLQGKLNATFEITLTANVASTDIAHPLLSGVSFIAFMPLTANAATEFGAGTLRVSAQGKETATITHANNANADRTFRLLVIG